MKIINSPLKYINIKEEGDTCQILNKIININDFNNVFISLNNLDNNNLKNKKKVK